MIYEKWGGEELKTDIPEADIAVSGIHWLESEELTVVCVCYLPCSNDD